MQKFRTWHREPAFTPLQSNMSSQDFILNNLKAQFNLTFDVLEYFHVS